MCLRYNNNNDIYIHFLLFSIILSLFISPLDNLPSCFRCSFSYTTIILSLTCQMLDAMYYNAIKPTVISLCSMLKLMAQRLTTHSQWSFQVNGYYSDDNTFSKVVTMMSDFKILCHVCFQLNLIRNYFTSPQLCTIIQWIQMHIALPICNWNSVEGF